MAVESLSRQWPGRQRAAPAAVWIALPAWIAIPAWIAPAAPGSLRPGALVLRVVLAL
jgi:hypothetical protein